MIISGEWKELKKNNSYLTTIFCMCHQNAQLEKGREPQTGQSACWHRQCSGLLAIRSKKT